MRCRFSHLKNTFAPVIESRVLEVRTGVRRAAPLMRSCAAAMSSKVTIGPIVEWPMDYSGYKDLKVRPLEPGIIEIVMGEEGKLAVATKNAHAEMARIWLDVDRDPEARVAILRGAGKGFSAGGDLAMVEEMTRDFAVRARVWREARDLVYNMINC